MLKNQARFKPARWPAFDNTNYSRWMIASVAAGEGSHGRKNERTPLRRECWAASAASSTDRSARTTTSSVAATARGSCRPSSPSARAILREGLAIEASPNASAGTTTTPRKFYYPVIPLVGAALQVPAPTWPRIGRRAWRSSKGASGCAAYIVPKLITSKTRWLLNLLAQGLWLWPGKQRLLKFVDQVSKPT